MATASIPQVHEDKGFLPRQTKLLLGAFIVLGAIAVFASARISRRIRRTLTAKR